MLENKAIRDRDFMRAFNANLREARHNDPRTPGTLVIEQTLRGQAPRFYLSREHVIRRLSERRRRPRPAAEKPHRTRMWQELEEALHARQARHPQESLIKAVDWVLENHSPSGFFISKDYAIKLMQKLTHKGL